MNLVVNVDNNLECALFKYKGLEEGELVTKKDIIFQGKVKKLQKNMKKLKDGKYNIVILNKEKKLQYGMLVGIKNKVISLIFK